MLNSFQRCYVKMPQLTNKIYFIYFINFMENLPNNANARSATIAF